ncbi:MAG: response regulator [Nitrospira sp.]|nr:response regulator [Nitrospira sp.]
MTTMPQRILIADDEETFRESTAEILAEAGYVCRAARDAAEAESLLETGYDLLLTDVRMPGNSQLEFLETVSRRHPELPVVVITGYPTVGTAVESFRLSIVDYLIKPIGLEDLKRAVERGLRRRTLVGAVNDAMAETAKVAGIFDQLGRSMSEFGRGGSQLEWSAHEYMAQAMGHIARLSALVGRTLEASRGSKPQAPTDVCALMQCPRLDRYEAAIQDAVAVMERTRSSFKSKEIGALRQRLETLLREGRRPG